MIRTMALLVAATALIGLMPPSHVLAQGAPPDVGPPADAGPPVDVPGECNAMCADELATCVQAAATLLANPVIEDHAVHAAPDA